MLQVYEVFGQKEAGEPHSHIGSLLAGDLEMAFLLAKECFTRRAEYVDLWVVARQDVRRATPDEARMFQPATDRSYRLAEGYRVTVDKWRQLQALRHEQEEAPHDA